MKTFTRIVNVTAAIVLALMAVWFFASSFPFLQRFAPPRGMELVALGWACLLGARRCVDLAALPDPHKETKP